MALMRSPILLGITLLTIACGGGAGSKGENWLFQSVQRKKKENSQCSRPSSGRTEFMTCADAANRARSVRMWAVFWSTGRPPRAYRKGLPGANR